MESTVEDNRRLWISVVFDIAVVMEGTVGDMLWKAL